MKDLESEIVDVVVINSLFCLLKYDLIKIKILII